jgi:flagellar motor switch protein FliM
MKHIKDTRFPITGQLGVLKLDISDIYHLQVGDVIDLNKSTKSQVKLYVGRQPWFTGTMGVHKKNIAVRIEDRIRPMGKDKPTEEIIADLLSESVEQKTG